MTDPGGRSDPSDGVAFARAVLTSDDPRTPGSRWLRPAPDGTSVSGLVSHAVRRETLGRTRPRSGGSLRFPVRRSSMRLGARARTLRWLGAGVIVVPGGSSFPPAGSVLDQVAHDAGLELPHPALWPGSGGSLIVPARQGEVAVVLRLFAEHLAPAHEHAVRTLRHLAAHVVPCAPRLCGTGHLAPAVGSAVRWLVETRLPGTRPAHVDGRLGSQVLDFCVDLPAGPGAPSAPGDRIPEVLDDEVRRRLHGLAEQAAGAWAGEAAAPTHGDLWAGNLLVSGGNLSGVVDWDAYRDDVVPGVDLVHLCATDERLREHRTMGEELLARPWTRSPLRELGTAYFDRRGLRVDPDRWTATAVAWWLGQVSDTLMRTPELARDEQWVDRNITVVLDGLA